MLEFSKEWGIKIEESSPIQFIGTGSNLNEATENGIERASKILTMSKDEVKIRATITGGVEVARLPGVITLTLLVEKQDIESMGISKFINKQYKLL